jgi:hypothetical protein
MPPGRRASVRFADNRPAIGTGHIVLSYAVTIPPKAVGPLGLVKSKLIHEGVIKLFPAITVGLFIFLFALKELSHVETDHNRMWRQSH